MKQMVPTKVTYGDAEYAIYPFPAMDAAGIAGDLAKFAGPIIAAIAPLVFGGDGDTDISGEKAMDRLMKTDIKDVGPMVSTALSTLGNDNVQHILSELLLDHMNIAVEYRDDNGKLIQRRLTRELANELFIGQLDAMVMLCLDVINLNFKGFFTNMITQSGNRIRNQVGSIIGDTESSTSVDTII